jgi:hypothetical protein
MATYRYFAYDVLETFRQTHDDKELTLSQVLFWIQLIENRLRSQHIKKRLKDGSIGRYLCVFPEVPVIKQTQNAENLTKNRYYFDLPKDIYDFPNEAGIDYITHCASDDICCDGLPIGQIYFQHTVPSKLHVLYGDSYMKPSPEQPYWYRTKNRIWLIGFECVDISCVEIGLYTKIEPDTNCDLDEEIDLDDELLTVLKYEVLDLGRWALMIPRERVNDGSDMTTQQINANKIQIPEVSTAAQQRELMRQQQQQQQTPS